MDRMTHKEEVQTGGSRSTRSSRTSVDRSSRPLCLPRHVWPQYTWDVTWMTQPLRHSFARQEHNYKPKWGWRHQDAGCACRRESGHTSTTFGIDADKGMAGILWFCLSPQRIQCARDKYTPFYYTDQTWTEKHGGSGSSTVHWMINTSPLS